MALEADIYNALKTLAGGRVYPDVAPAGAALPYITWQQIGGYEPAFIDGQVADKCRALIQINVWNTSRLSCNTLARQAKTALVSALYGEAEGAFAAEYDPTTASYGTSQDIAIWSSN